MERIKKVYLHIKVLLENPVLFLGVIVVVLVAHYHFVSVRIEEESSNVAWSIEEAASNIESSVSDVGSSVSDIESSVNSLEYAIDDIDCGYN